LPSKTRPGKPVSMRSQAINGRSHRRPCCSSGWQTCHDCTASLTGRGRPPTVTDGLDYLESFLLAIIDAALAAQNALIALESLGLGTCYIGALRNDPVTVARELNLPKQVFPVFGLTVGFPDPAIKTDVKPRLPQTAVLHREQYRDNPSEEELYSYNQTLRAFQKIQSMAPIDWSEQAARRIATKDALKHRDKAS